MLAKMRAITSTLNSMYIPLTFQPRPPPPFSLPRNQFECICVCIKTRSIVLYFTICKSVVRQLPALLLALLFCGFCKLSRHGHGVVGSGRRRTDSFVLLFHFKIVSTIHRFLLLLLPSSKTWVASIHNLFSGFCLAMKLSKLVLSEWIICSNCHFHLSPIFLLNLKSLHNKTQTNKTQFQTNQAHKHYTSTNKHKHKSHKKKLYDKKFI